MNRKKGISSIKTLGAILCAFVLGVLAENEAGAELVLKDAFYYIEVNNPYSFPTHINMLSQAPVSDGLAGYFYDEPYGITRSMQSTAATYGGKKHGVLIQGQSSASSQARTRAKIDYSYGLKPKSFPLLNIFVPYTIKFYADVFTTGAVGSPVGFPEIGANVRVKRPDDPYWYTIFSVHCTETESKRNIDAIWSDAIRPGKEYEMGLQATGRLWGTGSFYAYLDPVFAIDPDHYFDYKGQSYRTAEHFEWVFSPGLMDAVPIPGAVWLLGTGLLGFVSIRRMLNR